VETILTFGVASEEKCYTKQKCLVEKLELAVKSVVILEDRLYELCTSTISDQTLSFLQLFSSLLYQLFSMFILLVSFCQLTGEVTGIPLVNWIFVSLLTFNSLSNEASSYFNHKYFFSSVDGFMIVHDERKCFCEHLSQRHNWNRIWLSRIKPFVLIVQSTGLINICNASY